MISISRALLAKRVAKAERDARRRAQHDPLRRAVAGIFKPDAPASWRHRPSSPAIQRFLLKWRRHGGVAVR